MNLFFQFVLVWKPFRPIASPGLRESPQTVIFQESPEIFAQQLTLLDHQL
jgi:hypothetical protein